MRLIYTFITAILISVNPSLAQTKFRAGVSAGTILSTLIRDGNILARGGFVGYKFGALGKLNVGDLGWFFQSGAEYTLEGDVDQKLNFVKMPLTLGVDVAEALNLHVKYLIAWQIGTDQGVQDFYKSTASILGLGTDVYVSRKFGIGGSLNYGLSNLVSDSAEAGNFKVKPFGFELYLMYYIF